MTPERLATIRKLADEDPYYRGYLDGLTDKHNALDGRERHETPQQ